jgi:sRNA-binding protein
VHYEDICVFDEGDRVKVLFGKSKDMEGTVIMVTDSFYVKLDNGTTEIYESDEIGLIEDWI